MTEKTDAAPPLLDGFSVASILVLLGLSTIMYRRHVSAAWHAIALAGLCGAVIAVWIVWETLILTATDSSTISDLISHATRPVSVVSGLTLPMLILLLLGGWHLVTCRWHITDVRTLIYAVQWIIIIAWVAVSLLEPTSVFAIADGHDDLAPTERSDFILQNFAAGKTHDRAVLGYFTLVAALFILPPLLSLRRKT